MQTRIIRFNGETGCVLPSGVGNIIHHIDKMLIFQVLKMKEKNLHPRKIYPKQNMIFFKILVYFTSPPRYN
jgi:hypothetical protein